MMLSRPRRTREITGSQPHSVGLIAKPTSSVAPDKIVREARRQQERLEEAALIAKQNRLADIKSDWETTTNRKIMLNNVKSKMAGMKAARTAELENRRERLRQLLGREEDSYINEMVNKEETQLERQAKMREKARLLREKRESERRAFAQEKLEQQFRLQCEELRSTQSKRNEDLLAAERLEQIREKEQKKLDEKKHEEFYHKMWEADIAAKTKREEEDERKRMAGNDGMLEVLQQQIAAHEMQKEEEKRIKKEEENLLAESRRLRKIEEERALRDKQMRGRETREMLDRSIKLKEQRKARELQEELAFDMKQLEELLEASKNEIKEQTQRKKELREEDARYRQYLRDLKIQQQKEEEEMDRICNLQIQDAYRKQTEQRRLEREARKKLFNRIIAERRQQIEDRIKEKEREKEMNRILAEQQKKVFEQNRLEDLEKQKLAKEKLKAHQYDILGQIEYNNRQREIAFLEEDRLNLAQNAAEAEYRAKIAEALQDVSDPYLHPMRKALSAKRR
ncbi:DgyrCDS10111 [Dimorphilus gyrociliatus]|uniref:Cilia- and flagella-associated protein 53 n=1 Tax=Dimorphilus gyrociliatus TaxID=2664684 RepID=A0A7I8W0C7_9ANNE|nr:DgyrCDS10111 [Dimorphilus gyrociliatus]